MPKGKKKEKMKDPPLDPVCDVPFDACKTFLVELAMRFYEANFGVALGSKHMIQISWGEHQEVQDRDEGEY